MAKINYISKIEKLLAKSPKVIYVDFALYCAKDQLHNIKDEKLYKQCYDALVVVEAYNNGLATKSEVNAAHSAASSATHATYSATYNAASSATHAAHSAAHSAASSAARAAHSAASSAAYAAHNATHATYATSSAACSDKLKQYYEHLLPMCNSLTRLEKIIYGVSCV